MIGCLPVGLFALESSFDGVALGFNFGSSILKILADPFVHSFVLLRF